VMAAVGVVPLMFADERERLPRWEVVKTHTSSCELASASLRGAGDDSSTPVFVTGGTDNWVHLWDFETDKELGTRHHCATQPTRVPWCARRQRLMSCVGIVWVQVCTRGTTARCTA
jgi:hypothetical protein